MQERRKNAVRRQILTQIFDRQQFFDRYLQRNISEDACRPCPYYGKRWSCPPGLPEPNSYLENYDRVCVVVLKVDYPEEMREKSLESEKYTEKIRGENYEAAKKELLLKLLDLERKIPGSKALGAGRCILCEHCTREDGKPCRNPRLRRYSITGFGMDFAKLLEEEFQVSMLWAASGLPEYDVAVAALFLPAAE